MKADVQEDFQADVEGRMRPLTWLTGRQRDPNSNLESANITFNGTFPENTWRGLTGSETYTQNGEHLCAE